MTSKQARPRGVLTLSHDQMVLLALYHTAEGTTRRAAYEDLVLQAWHDFPGHFSLRNHPEYPDASDIHKRLYSGLKQKGLVVSLGNKFFRLTEEGLKVADRLHQAAITDDTRAAADTERISREEEAFIQHALTTRAFVAWLEGKAADLVDYDGRIFFRFSTSTSHDERGRRVHFALAAIDHAIAAGRQHAQALRALAMELLQRFRTQLGVSEEE